MRINQACIKGDNYYERDPGFFNLILAKMLTPITLQNDAQSASGTGRGDSARLKLTVVGALVS